MLFQANVCTVSSVLARQALFICIVCFFTAASLPIEFHSHLRFRDGCPHPTQRPLTLLLLSLPSGVA